MRTLVDSRKTVSLILPVVAGLSLLWFASAGYFYVVNRNSKDGWSVAPVAIVWALLIIPMFCSAGAAYVVSLRRAQRREFHRADSMIIAAAVAPFALVIIGFLFLLLCQLILI